jgi:hypothetical protein
MKSLSLDGGSNHLKGNFTPSGVAEDRDGAAA